MAPAAGRLGRNPSRRAVLAGAGLAAAAAPAPGAAPAAEKASPSGPSPDVYTRAGIKPFINLTATFTINGGTLTLPEVKRAMDDASYFSVNLDEVMDKVGVRLAELLGCGFGIVTPGASAAITLGTMACMTGGDPEKMKLLPDASTLRNEVIITRQSRNDYDHAFRSAGARLIEVDTREEFHNALGHKTAMVAILGTAEARGNIRLEEIAEAAHKAGVPVFVDAAAELPLRPNPFLSRGADLVAYSGGKILRGPQCAGLLLGRRDLVKAAFLNSAPHHGYGRALKVGKEEIMGMLTAVEMFVHKRKLEEEYRVWESWYGVISNEISRIPSVRTRVIPAAGASPFPVLEVTWDPKQVAITAGEVGEAFLNGEPRIMSHASGDGSSFIIRPVSMKPEHPPLVAARLAAILRGAPKSRPAAAPRPPAADLSGEWEVAIQFVSGATTHTLALTAKGSSVSGIQAGRITRGRIAGKVDGPTVTLNGTLPYEGYRLQYHFKGDLSADGRSFAGDVGLGEYGSAKFTARRTA
ncbi:MAG: aminotransferase class V-fold PLP-dependent enzyme [Acidobacteria bacterium]|nr:aminotransferase class V-fold PLP-dependent enzyme [Acidobacteriota bacterium]